MDSFQISKGMCPCFPMGSSGFQGYLPLDYFPRAKIGLTSMFGAASREIHTVLLNLSIEKLLAAPAMERIHASYFHRGKWEQPYPLRAKNRSHTRKANVLTISMGRCLHLWPWGQVHITPYAWQHCLKSMSLDGN